MAGHSIQFPTLEHAHQLVRSLTIPSIFVSYWLIKMSLPPGGFDPEGDFFSTNPIGIPHQGLSSKYISRQTRTVDERLLRLEISMHLLIITARFPGSRVPRQTFYSTIRLLYQPIKSLGSYDRRSTRSCPNFSSFSLQMCHGTSISARSHTIERGLRCPWYLLNFPCIRTTLSFGFDSHH